MKKPLIFFFLFSLSLIFAVSCNKFNPVGPIRPPSPPTPVCGLIPVVITYNSAAVVTATPTATPVSTPIPTPTFVPTTFTGQTRVLRTLTDWQTYYGAIPAPVNFSQQMILQAFLNVGCLPNQEISNVCLSSTQLNVYITNVLPAPNTVTCQAIAFTWVSVVAPQSNLPIVWTVADSAYYPP